MSNLTEQSEVIKSIDNAAYIENHVSPHCRIDGMSASEYVRTKALHQIEIARLNAIIERQKAEMVVMQARIDELVQGVNFALGHCEGLRGFHAELDEYVNMASDLLGAI